MHTIINRNMNIWIYLLLFFACKEKEPYKILTDDVTQRQVFTDTIVEPKPMQKEVSASKPVAVIVTKDGSFLVSSRGGEFDVKKIPYIVRVSKDGSIKGFKIKEEKQDGLVFASIFHISNGTERVVFASEKDEIMEFYHQQIKVLPEQKEDFYYDEVISILGMHDNLVSFRYGYGEYLGGAHPSSDNQMMVFDIETGEKKDLLYLFKNRDLVREALGNKYNDDECLKRLAGVGPVDDRGGEKIWLILLSHEYEYCRGEMRLIKVNPPKGEYSKTSTDLSFSQGVLRIKEIETKFENVIDYRVDEKKMAVVLLMSLNSTDKLQPPWDLNDKGPTREVRIWVRGMTTPTLLGRTRTILSVQFLLDHDMPDKVMKGFESL